MTSPRLAAKPRLGPADDPFEREADRVADRVMRMPDAGERVQRACAGCEAEEELREGGGSPTVRRRAAGGAPSEIPGPVADRVQALQGAGRPLPAPLRSFYEPRFGRDFGAVRLHTGPEAAGVARSLGARAFTLGRDVVLGEPLGATPGSRHLLAHELAHVVQQGQAPRTRRDGPAPAGDGGATHGPVVQRRTTTLQGIDDQCVEYADRDLRSGSGSLPRTSSPGGTAIPDTEGPHQNCAGVSLCDRGEYINWPRLGLEAGDGVRRPGIDADWDVANYFVPTGCSPVSCSGISLNSTRCSPTEREVIVFLYRWPRGFVRGTTIPVYQSDFHMIGRTPSSLPMAWVSKMDRRERVEDIRDPWQSLYDAYPHTRQPDREVRQHCFCCDCADVVTR